MIVKFPYGDPAISSASIPDDALMGVIGPKVPDTPAVDVEKLVVEALRSPIASPQLLELASPDSRVVLLVDDISRNTPIDRMLPPVLAELARAGVQESNIKGIIALGTHRPMTQSEIETKCGAANTLRIKFINHAWDNPDELVNLGTTELGFDIQVNRHLAEADLAVGFGHIVPHSDVGFSGGGKIVMPGVSGPETLDRTHWATLSTPPSKMLGWRENPIREAIDEIARRSGMNFIVNTVPVADGTVQEIFCGDVTEAHRQGCECARRNYSVPIPALADIVVVDSSPADIDLRQAIKGVLSGSVAVKPGGVLVLVTPCPEGVAPQFPEYEEIGFRAVADIETLVQQGRISRVSGQTLAVVGQILADGLTVILASPGIKRETAERMGLLYAPSAQAAVDDALALRPDGRLLVLQHGAELLPVVLNEKPAHSQN